MNASGVSRPSEALPLRGVSFPLRDGLGEVAIEHLEDGTVRFTDRVEGLPPYTLEFSREEWKWLVEYLC
jgi:hypothetical protein